MSEIGKMEKMNIPFSTACQPLVDVYFLSAGQETTCTAVSDVKSKIPKMCVVGMLCKYLIV